MSQYRTAGVLDEGAVWEISRCFLPHRTIWATRIAAAFFAAVAILELIAKDGFYTVVFALFAAFFMFIPRYYIKRFATRSIALLKEGSPGGVRHLESFFDADGMVILNQDTGGEGRLLYPAFSQAAETEHYFFLLTKAGQYCLVFKDYLTPEQRTGFLPFLRGKCPKLKVI